MCGLGWWGLSVWVRVLGFSVWVRVVGVSVWVRVSVSVLGSQCVG